MIILAEPATVMNTNSPFPYAHWMLREIYEQPATLSATVDHYVAGNRFQADTCAGTRNWLASLQGNLSGHATLAITNVSDSTMAREATASFPTLAGRERAIPATKSFTAQLLNLYLLGLMSAQARGAIDSSELALRLWEVAQLGPRIEKQLKGWDDAMREVAEAYRAVKNFLYLGG